MRVFPVYYLALLSIFIFYEMHGIVPSYRFWVHTLYIQNLVPGYTLSKNGPVGMLHFWSLAVEEQFYLLWPFVVPGLARLLERNRPRLVMQSMLKQGETKGKAEERVDLGLALLRYLGQARLLVRDGAEATRFELSVQLSKATERQPRP